MWVMNLRYCRVGGANIGWSFKSYCIGDDKCVLVVVAVVKLGQEADHGATTYWIPGDLRPQGCVCVTDR